ncbi:MAG: hypothetical protein HQL99_16550 [Magnetococcales bacterium]|nr:hypothetical protein [Magnetococcales bacterium]
MNDIMGLDIQALVEENHRLHEENQRLRDLVARQEGQIARQEEQIAVLIQRVEMLEERLRQNSRNSSKSPSGDGPAAGKQSKAPTGRKRGGQVGHPGTKRELLPPEQVDETVELKPEVCAGCGQALEGGRPIRTGIR